MEKQILKSGGILTVDEHAIVCRFPSPRLVLSTSAFNGGYIVATAVFNQCLDIFVNSENELPGGSMKEYLSIKANEQALHIQKSTGLLTSARMHCRGFSMMEFDGIIVEVIATAGVDKNAVRAGDPASYYEDSNGYQSIGGTINIIALTNVQLPQGTMAKALLSITEAKTAALQELAVVSPFTLHSATGTGTDGIMIACDPESTVLLTDTGTQSKLGELLCQAVKIAIKQSLAKECAIEPLGEGRATRRLQKLGISGIKGLELPLSSPQDKILLAMYQSIWQEYSWGLLSVEDIVGFISLLEEPIMQPLGGLLSMVLRKKMDKTFYDERMNQYSGGVL